MHREFVRRDIPALRRKSFQEFRPTVPTLILLGADDVVISPRMLRGGDEFADDLTVTVVPDCGHHLPAERPDLVAAAALELFGRAVPAPSDEGGVSS